MWPDSTETQELLAAARDGDAEARNRLLERHRDALRRMVGMRMDRAVQTRVDASDIVQDVLVEANRRLTDYLATAKMPFALWLRHLARDHLIDAHRRHRGAARRSVDREQPLATAATADQSAMDLAALLARSRNDAGRRRHASRAGTALRGGVETLDEMDREIILMRHFEHLSNQEAAQALELSEPAAGMRYLRDGAADAAIGRVPQPARHAMSTGRSGGEPATPSGSVSPTAAPTTERDELLARLLDELAEQMRRGQPPAIDALLAQHADLADELRPCGPPCW